MSSIKFNIDIFQYGICFKLAITLFTKNIYDEKYDAETTYLSIFEDSLVCGIEADPTISDTIDEDLNTEGLTLYDLYENLARQVGKVWYIDDFTLKMIGEPASTDDAIYNIDPHFTSFSDYRNVQINDRFENYANGINIVGSEHLGATLKYLYFSNRDYDDFLSVSGYGGALVEVVSDTNIKRYPFQSTADTGTVEDEIVDTHSDEIEELETDDYIYNKTQDVGTFVSTITTFTTVTAQFNVLPTVSGQTSGDLIWYNPGMKESAKTMLDSKGDFPPLEAIFETNTLGFYPRNRMLINLPDLDCNRYFNITNVLVTDLGSGLWNFVVKCESIKYDKMNFKERENYLDYWRKF